MSDAKRLVSDETKAAIIADYQAGKRILDMEDEHGVSRATLYWVLDQAGVLPARLNRGERLRGTTQQMAGLYALITAQEEYISVLEEAVASYSKYVPEDVRARVRLELLNGNQEEEED